MTPEQFMRYDDAEDPVPLRRGPWFRAHYDGECDGCGEEFEAGDQIRSDGKGGWLAECCGEDEDVQP
jgi:hypothetical protein